MLLIVLSSWQGRGVCFYYTAFGFFFYYILACIYFSRYFYRDFSASVPCCLPFSTKWYSVVLACLVRANSAASTPRHMSTRTQQLDYLIARQGRLLAGDQMESGCPTAQIILLSWVEQSCCLLSSRLLTPVGVSRFYAVVVMRGQTNSTERARSVGELLTGDGHVCDVLSMVPYEEGHIRAMLEQARGSAAHGVASATLLLQTTQPPPVVAFIG